MKYHAGEIQIQELTGVRWMAERIGNGIHTFMPAMAMAFLAEQPFVVISALDTEGLVWASPLSGEFVALDERHIAARNALSEDDPLYESLLDGAAIGMIFIEFATRRRMRVNGIVQNRNQADFEITVQQAYANCAKHIHPREHSQKQSQREIVSTSKTGLTVSQRQWIEEAYTLFIASLHSESGADASHRGGASGFVHVVDESHIQIPDYAGNMMFNTLGNILANPDVGLLFIDFETGRLLQLSGKASLCLDKSVLENFPRAERLIELSISKVIERIGVIS